MPSLAALAGLAVTRRMPSSPVAAIDDAWPIVRHDFVSLGGKRVCLMALPMCEAPANTPVVKVPEITAALDLLCDLQRAIEDTGLDPAAAADADKLLGLIQACMPFGTPIHSLRSTSSSRPTNTSSLLNNSRWRIWIEETVYAQLYDSSVDADKRDAWAVVASLYCASSEASATEITARVSPVGTIVTEDCVVSAEDGNIVFNAPPRSSILVCRFRVDHMSTCASPPLWLPWPSSNNNDDASPRSAGTCQPIHATLRLRRSSKDKCHLLLRISGPSSLAVDSLFATVRLPTARVLNLSLEASVGSFVASTNGLRWDLRDFKGSSAILSGVVSISAEVEDGFFAGETSCAEIEFRLWNCAASSIKILQARPTGQAPITDLGHRVVVSGKFVVWNENGRMCYVP